MNKFSLVLIIGVAAMLVIPSYIVHVAKAVHTGGGGSGKVTGASGFAPGHEVSSIGSGLPGDAQNFAPGHQIPPGPAQHQHDGASDFAPGIEAKCTPGSPCP